MYRGFLFITSRVKVILAHYIYRKQSSKIYHHGVHPFVKQILLEFKLYDHCK